MLLYMLCNKKKDDFIFCDYCFYPICDYNPYIFVIHGLGKYNGKKMCINCLSKIIKCK